METISKRWLIEQIVKSIPKKQRFKGRYYLYKRVINEFLRRINEAMLNGKEVALRKFGRFYTYTWKRPYTRNPKTGVTTSVPIQLKKVAFKCSEKMRERLNVKDDK